MAEVCGPAAKSPFALARERLGLAEAWPAAGDRSQLGGWPPQGAWSRKVSEESDDEGVAMWQELSAEGSATSSMARAAASAAAALAHGAPLPPGTAAAVRRNSVPGLLAMDVHLPEGQPEEQQPGMPASAGVDAHSECKPSPLPSGGQPGTSAAAVGGSSPGRSSAGDPTTVHMALACGGYPQGTCTFTLSSPASDAERLHLAGFCGRLGCELERARYHLAKQQLEGSLDELSQALASGGASSLRAASLPEGLMLPTLPTVPSWRSSASVPAVASQGWGGSSADSSAAASPTARATTPPEGAGQGAAPDAMDEGA